VTALTIIAALWARIPTKDKLYALLVVAILVAFGALVHHERSVGAANLSAVQAKLATAQAAIAAKKTAQGVTNSTSAEVRYVSTINTVIPDSPHLLLLDSGTAACAVSVSDSSQDGIPAAESTVEHSRDVGPELDKIGRDSDAQVTYLQDVLRSCINIGACKLQE